MKKKARALALLSGGLDSILAVWLILQQKIEVIGINFTTPFFSSEKAIKASKFLNIPLEIIDITEEYLDILKNPKYGYGKNLNPCIDCHALMLKKSFELMKKYEGDFIITGEVLGERPMSQNINSLNIVAKYSGVEDYVLRPLSAKLLPITKPEREGLVEREKLLGIKGRSRKIQLELARNIGLKEIPTPSGGCLLTEKLFSKKLLDLLKNKENITRRDLELLKIGRHFRLSNNIKLIIGRNKDENEKLLSFFSEQDTLFKAKEPSALVLVPDQIIKEKEDKEFIAKIAAYYSDHKMDPEIPVLYKTFYKEEILLVRELLKENLDFLKYNITCK
ncbi:MAG: tRNA 4-thiouridine(8) synthase ThiI [Dictyoglomus sp.]|nr:tRNA 4-thiouridine(8) synthase ThiI [Dictyoglomus sp.]MCX7942004.1 tRNA 4-thiouridine(8) synthase ThiI [Dictyoglomaceae bacterium]MDW8188734.1 tRNA 4-thiouridine(8) synthase ThiI [Dictyoglomus sp.]